MKRPVGSMRGLAALIAIAAVSLAVGVGIGTAGGSGSSEDGEQDGLVTTLNYRMDAAAPRPRLRNILNSDGLQLEAACQRANGLPVLEFALSSRVAASFGLRAGYQDDETDTRVFHGVSPGQVIRILGPIGKGDGATGALTYLRPDGRAVTVNFVAMTRAAGSDCVVGGTVIRSPE
jgi:hypothetical protein